MTSSGTQKTVDPNLHKKHSCDRLIQMLRDHQLSQMQHDTTREDKVLDLFCTNKRSLVKAMTTVPGISDHDAIVADCDVQPAYIKKKPRSIIPLLKSKLVRNEK